MSRAKARIEAMTPEQLLKEQGRLANAADEAHALRDYALKVLAEKLRRLREPVSE